MKTIVITNGKSNGRYDFIANDITTVQWTDFVDARMFVETYLTSEKYVLYIPTTTTADSALTYSGVVFSLWVYMLSIQKQYFRFHLVLLGTEAKGAFFEHCKYANLILAPNVHYVQNSKEELVCFNKQANFSECFKKEKLIEALKRVNVEPPTAFKNAHTITNEWCISRWSKALGLNLPDTEKEKSLYFTYLKTILPINEVKTVRNLCSSTNKVLVVDDEMDKGWRDFFEALLPGHVLCIGEGFKQAVDRDEIVRCVKNTVTEYNPDTVVLDLRLHDSDHNAIDPKRKLTGVKVLEEIKRINKGIQVVGFTASNKVWNLLAWQEYGVDDFIIKESPLRSVEAGYTERSITQLMEAIEKAASKAYLKDIYVANYNAKDRLRQLKSKRQMDKGMADAVVGYLNLAQSSLFASKPNHETAFMYYFLILEAFSAQMIDEKGVQGADKLYYFKFRRDDTYLMQFNERNGRKKDERLWGEKASESQHSRIPYNQKMYNMIDYVGLKDVDPVGLVKIRNKFNHPNFIDSKKVELSRQNVLDIMNVVCKLIQNYR